VPGRIGCNPSVPCHGKPGNVDADTLKLVFDGRQNNEGGDEGGGGGGGGEGGEVADEEQSAEEVAAAEVLMEVAAEKAAAEQSAEEVTAAEVPMEVAAETAAAEQSAEEVAAAEVLMEDAAEKAAAEQSAEEVDAAEVLMEVAAEKAAAEEVAEEVTAAEVPMEVAAETAAAEQSAEEVAAAEVPMEVAAKTAAAEQSAEEVAAAGVPMEVAAETAAIDVNDSSEAAHAASEALAASRRVDAARKRTARELHKLEADSLTAMMPFSALAGRFPSWGAAKIERLHAWGVAPTISDPWTTVGAFGNASELLVRRSGREIRGISELSVVRLWHQLRDELGLQNNTALTAMMPFSALAGRFPSWGADRIERLRAWGVAPTISDPWTTVGAFGNASELLVRRSGREIRGISELSVVRLWQFVRVELGLENAEASQQSVALSAVSLVAQRWRARAMPPVGALELTFLDDLCATNASMFTVSSHRLRPESLALAAAAIHEAAAAAGLMSSDAPGAVPRPFSLEDARRLEECAAQRDTHEDILKYAHLSAKDVEKMLSSILQARERCEAMTVCAGCGYRSPDETYTLVVDPFDPARRAPLPLEGLPPDHWMRVPEGGPAARPI
jgi:hypothetical protein